MANIFRAKCQKGWRYIQRTMKLCRRILFRSWLCTKLNIIIIKLSRLRKEPFERKEPMSEPFWWTG